MYTKYKILSFCSNIRSVVSNPPAANLHTPSLPSVSPPYDLEEVDVTAFEHFDERQSEPNLLSVPNPTTRRKRNYQSLSLWVWGPPESANGKLVIADNIE